MVLRQMKAEMLKKIYMNGDNFFYANKNSYKLNILSEIC